MHYFQGTGLSVANDWFLGSNPMVCRYVTASYTVADFSCAIPEIQKSFSFLSKNLSDAFYNFDKKELEWHKFSIAFNAFVCLKPDDNNNIILQKLKNHFNSAFFSIFRVLNLNRDLSKLKNIERHCPNCGFTINKVLEPREYHLVCPKCKTHFIIDGDIKRIIDSASSLDRDITDKECKAILENERLKKRNK